VNKNFHSSIASLANDLKKSYNQDFVSTLDHKYHESVQESVDRLRVSEFNHKRTLDTLRNSVDHLSVQYKTSTNEFSSDLAILKDK